MNEYFANDDLRIRVVIVDDHPIARNGTHNCLKRAEDITVVGVTGEGVTALGLVAEQRPDVLILDLHLPDISGIEVAHQVKSEFSDTALLILTGYDDIRYVRTLLQVGVQGYLAKTVSCEEIVNAVRAVATGKRVLICESLTGVADNGSGTLTERERQVLRLLVADCRNTEIATILNVTVKTVEFHIGHILEKLGARSRASAIRKAQEHGLLEG